MKRTVGQKPKGEVGSRDGCFLVVGSGGLFVFKDENNNGMFIGRYLTQPVGSLPDTSVPRKTKTETRAGLKMSP